MGFLFWLTSEGKVLQCLDTALMFARVSTRQTESSALNLDLEQPRS